MNSTPYTAPSQYVKDVITELGNRLDLDIRTIYVREPTEQATSQVFYHTGDVDSSGEYANDGRKQHEIELRFLVHVSTALDDFELEALDLATRIERELMCETFNQAMKHDAIRLLDNSPRKFDPENGFFLRVVTVKQQIRMGPLLEESFPFGGSELNDFSTG